MGEKNIALIKDIAKKKRKIILVLVSILVMVLIFRGLNYSWSNKLIGEIRNDNFKNVQTLIENNKIFSVNQPAGTPWLIRFVPECFAETPLQVACEKSNFDIVNLLVEHGAKVNKRALGTEYPIIMTFTFNDKNDYDILKLLVENGADPNVTDSYDNKLILQIAAGTPYIHENEEDEDSTLVYNEEMAENILYSYKYVLNYVEDKETVTQNTGDNALLCAVAMKNKPLVKYLLEEQNVDINYENDFGETALFQLLAIDQYNKDQIIELAELLVEHNIDRSHKDMYGKTAYDYAVEEDYDKLVEILKL